MDNPQMYQPLSAALHHSNPPSLSSMPYQRRNVIPEVNSRLKEEEEDDDDDDDDEEEERINDDHTDNRDKLSPKPGLANTDTRSTRGALNQTPTPPAQTQVVEESPRKRRPGRPRGSKNRKPRSTLGQATTKLESRPTGQSAFFTYSSKTSSTVGPSNAPPQHPINSQNQPYYDFQWRVLNLCAEFYCAAEELLKETPPLVVAQCYHTNPTSKVDPLSMLGEAKRICDTLFANPSQLATNPPPSISTVPTLNPANITPRINHAPSAHNAPTNSTIITPAAASPTPAPTPAPAPTPTTSVPPASMTSKFSSTPTVITNPQSFVVPLGPPPPTAYQFSMYPPQYPTAPYYQYPSYVPPGATYYPTHQAPPPSQTAQPASTPTPASAQLTSSPNSTGGGNQGAWSDEETERLKNYADQSRSVGTSGEIEWDWVVHQWGPGRTRHQILIKATSMGLKETSGRGIKRRRENDMDAPSPTTPSTTSSQPAPLAPHAVSPPQSHTAPTPIASPTLQNQQRPPSSAPKPPAPTLPWPMPTIAVTTVSPVITPSSSNTNSNVVVVGVNSGANGTGGSGSAGEPQRSNYYRHRPSQGGREMTSKPLSAGATNHQGGTSNQYMYQTNGNRKDNAK